MPSFFAPQKAWMVKWFWTGHLLPHYHNYRESRDIPAAFYCRQFRWLWGAVYWGLNQQGRKGLGKSST